MFKFLRKYNKVILVVGGVLLMIAFLIPQGATRLGNAQERIVVATVDGRKVRLRQMEKARIELLVLRAFAAPIVDNLLGVEDRPDHWFLLTREAERGGFVGEDADGRDWVPVIAEFFAEQYLRSEDGAMVRFQLQMLEQQGNFQEAQDLRQRLLGEILANLEASRARALAQSRMTEADFDRALARARGVYRMVEAYHRAARVSDRRALLASAENRFLAEVEWLLIPAERFVDSASPVDDATLAATFERFKGTPEGGGEYGIGYLLPPRVKLEWLTLSRAAVEESIKPDPVEVRKRYQQDRATYTGEFDAERSRVAGDIRREQADRLLAEADTAVRAELAKATRGLAADGEFKVLPPDWSSSRPTLERIAQGVVEQVRARTGVVIPLPEVTIRSAGWVTAREISQIPGIGSAVLRSGTMAVPFPLVPFQVRELGGDPRLRLQVGLTSVEHQVTDAAGNRYYFTVLDARPESPPDSLDEIRERVAADARRLAAYESLVQQAPSYLDVAVSGGLQAIADSLNAEVEPESLPEPDSTEPRTDKPKLTVFPGGSVTRPRAVLSPPTLDQPALREAVMRAAESIDPMVDIETVEASRRVVVVPVPQAMGLAVLRISRVTPLTTETFRLAAEMDAYQAQVAEMNAAGLGPESRPFSFERLARRHRYQPVGPKGEALPVPAPAPEARPAGSPAADPAAPG